MVFRNPLALALTGLLAPASVACTGLGLPTVDLLTSVHVASLNVSGGFYSFSNIPYAEPPVGQLRFRVPIPKITINRTLNDGSVTRICPQGNGAWLGISVPFMIETITGQSLPPSDGSTGAPAADPRESEDCLYLDVKTPRAVFDQGVSGLPVVVWIHGGGFASGSKDGVNPAGLIAQGLRDGKPGFVYVGINYRLGLFGFPPRGTFDWDVATNAGLYDQRLALLWVQANIRRFGGDPNAVTVIGESAGASSIAAQLTAFGGFDGASPFKRAIIQSPAVRPVTDATVYAQVYQQFLGATGVSSIAAARDLPTAQLQGVNAGLIAGSSFGHFTFGPNVDGLMVPDVLARSLAKGRVDQNVEVIVAYNAAEGLLFTDPRVQNDTSFEAYFAGLMPSVSAAKIHALSTTVYPADFSGAQPYKTQTQRLTLAVSEALVSCNAFGLDLGYANKTRAYKFSVFPGVHAQDVSYTFFSGESADSLSIPVDTNVAVAMQRLFADFIRTGTASGSTATQIPVFTAQAKTLNITSAGNTVVTDPAANSRCRFWLESL